MLLQDKAGEAVQRGVVSSASIQHRSWRTPVALMSALCKEIPAQDFMTPSSTVTPAASSSGRVRT
jgi:hypothetical protein